MKVLFLFSLLLTYFNLQSQVINEDLVNKHISYLSSDELEGRKYDLSKTDEEIRKLMIGANKMPSVQ